MATDPAAIEHALTKIGAAFRLTRLYPATHPALADAFAQMAAVLAALADELPIELTVTPHGMQSVGAPPSVRGAAVAELAASLHAHGVRSMLVGEGARLEHLHALFAAANGTVPLDGADLGPIALSRTRRPTQRVAPEGLGRIEPAAPGRGAEPRLRETAGVVFRPDAMPADVATHRAVQVLRLAGDAAAQQAALGALAALAPDVLARRDAGLLAEAIAALELARLTTYEGSVPALERAVGAFTGPAALELLVARLADHRLDVLDRDLAARAVGVHGAVATAVVVEAYLAAPPDGRDPFRDAIRMAGGRAASRLEQMLDDARPDVVVAVVELLGLVPGPGSADLFGRLVRHGDARVREAALHGLAVIGGRTLARMVVPVLKDPSPTVRAAAARALSASGDPSATPLLIRRADEEEDEAVVTELLRGIGQLGGTEALRALTEFARPGGLLRRRSALVRGAAVAALGSLRVPEARALLEQYTHDREPAVRRAAEAAMQ